MSEFRDWREVLRAVHAKGWCAYAFAAFLVGCAVLVIAVPRQSARNALLAITPGQMPACDSPPTRHLLTQAINGSPAARTQGLVLHRVGSMRDAFPGIAEYAGQRTCVAEIYTNAGRENVTAVLSWTSADPDEVHLGVLGLF